MKHEAVIVKARKVSNGEVVIHAQCCGAAESEARHTIGIEGKPLMLTDAEIEAGIQDHLARTAALHEAMGRVEAIAAKYSAKG
jgi:hypothetical protein